MRRTARMLTARALSAGPSCRPGWSCPRASSMHGKQLRRPSGTWWLSMPDPPEQSEETQETQDARLDKVEAEQAEQGGKLDQILSILGKKEEGAHEKAEEHTESRLDRGSTVADQVKAAVEAVGAEKAQKEADAAHEADHAAIREAREK